LHARGWRHSTLVEHASPAGLLQIRYLQSSPPQQMELELHWRPAETQFSMQNPFLQAPELQSLPDEHGEPVGLRWPLSPPQIPELQPSGEQQSTSSEHESPADLHLGLPLGLLLLQPATMTATITAAVRKANRRTSIGTA
jgi:hypothetical protein